MHESEAMDFIASVLRGFFERTFQLTFDDGTKHLIMPLLDKIREYVKDEIGYWVKEKAIDVIHCIENLETKIVRGEYKPESPEKCVETALILAYNMMRDRIDVYKTEKDKDPKRVYESYPLPVL
ncbi:MAG: hypothetical protein LBG95_06975 [Treponema sp.]|jgi:hypothetical protein|nr:hypothetical protein [Treponema sp.]